MVHELEPRRRPCLFCLAAEKQRNPSHFLKNAKCINTFKRLLKTNFFEIAYNSWPLLQRLGWLSVDRLVHRETSTMVYKSLNGLAPDNLCQIFSRLSHVHSRVLRNTKCDLYIPRMRTAYGQNSIAFRGVDTWNKLHSDNKLAPSIQSFKAKLKAHN